MNYLVAQFLLLACLCPFALAQPQHPAKAELLADVSAIRPGEPFNVGIKLTMQPGWHVYWINPGDSGEPPTVTWSLPDGFEVGELQFPVPVRFDQGGGLVGYGYEDEVLLIANVIAPENLSADVEVRLAADVTWLVCADVCLPGSDKLDRSLAVSQTASPANRELFASWREKMPESNPDAVSNIRISTKVPQQHHEVELSVEWKDLPPKNLEWFPPVTEDGTFSEARITSTDNHSTIVTSFTPLAGKQVPEMTLQSVLAYDASDGSRRGIVVPFRFTSQRDDILLPTD